MFYVTQTSGFDIHLFVLAALVITEMLRNFKVSGRSQLLLATGYMHAVLSCQSPSGDGTYHKTTKTSRHRRPNFMQMRI